MTSPLFTVFTATFNRAATLPAVYDSLIHQSLKDFEWLIVDDGSTDSTQSLVDQWINDGAILVRYFRQSNGGKHSAFNRGVAEARGELFVTLDSDDAMTPNALEVFRDRWMAIPDQTRDSFSGVTSQCVDQSGVVVGTPLPSSFIDGRPFSVIDLLQLTGERFGFHRTNILKDHPFPVFSDERFVPEALVWNRIGRQYNIRFVSDSLRVYRQSDDSLSKSVVAIRRKSPRGTTLYYLEAVGLPIRRRSRLRHAVNAWRFATTKHSRRLVFEMFPKHPWLIGLALLPGLALSAFDGWRIR